MHFWITNQAKKHTVCTSLTKATFSANFSGCGKKLQIINSTEGNSLIKLVYSLTFSIHMNKIHLINNTNEN